MLALDKLLQRRLRIIVARSALVDLVDRRNPAIMLLDLANRMRVAVAVDARSLVLVNAAADRSQFSAVTVAAAVCVGQRLDTPLVTLVRDVRVTLAARDVRMRRGRILDIVVTPEAIQILGVHDCCDEEKSETEKRFRARGPGSGRIHCPESLCERLWEPKYYPAGDYAIAVSRSRLSD